MKTQPRGRVATPAVADVIDQTRAAVERVRTHLAAMLDATRADTAARPPARAPLPERHDDTLELLLRELVSSYTRLEHVGLFLRAFDDALKVTSAADPRADGDAEVAPPRASQPGR